MSAIPSGDDAFNRGSNSADRDKTGRFMTGNKSSRGRPRGSRVKLVEDVVTDVLDSWRRDGPIALARVASLEPGKYLDFIAKVLPREVKLEITTPTDGLSDERLTEMLDVLDAIAAGKTIEGEARNVTLPALAAPAPVPFADVPLRKVEQAQAAKERDLRRQAEHPNGVTAPQPINPEDLF